MAGGPGKWRWPTLIADLRNSCQVDPETGCLIWQGSTDRDGYAKFMIDHRHWRVSRAVLYSLTGILAPHAMHVKCDNPPCVEPTHLKWGTASENVRDAYRKNRAAMNLKVLSGSDNGRSKLTPEQRSEIVARRLAGEPRAVVAKAYGVGEDTVTRIASHAGARISPGRPRRKKRAPLL